jgi:hypothetical protein
MPTICPNCLRSLRTNANYCGYCGASLIPNAHPDAMALQASPQESDRATENVADSTPSKPRGKKNIRRIVLIVLIFLLCLVLLVAFLAHYWPTIIPNIGSVKSGILLL